MGVSQHTRRLLRFTFHYVSIKSNNLLSTLFRSRYLHSTMYLLNLECGDDRMHYHLCTFHYVSIKSISARTAGAHLIHLHSTMYLLNLMHTTAADNVDIYLHSTMYLLNLILLICVPPSYFDLHSTMYLLNPKRSCQLMKLNFIYIPLCIY